MDIFISVRKARWREEESVAVYNLSCVRESRVFIPVRPPSTEFVTLTYIRRVLREEHAEVDIIVVVVFGEVHCRFDAGLN